MAETHLMIRVTAETMKEIIALKPQVEALIKAQQGIDVPLALGSVVKFAVLNTMRGFEGAPLIPERKD